MQEYKLLQSDTTNGLERMVVAALNEQGMKLYGDAMEFGGRKVQVVVKGIDGSGAAESPQDVLVRIASAELKSAEATLKAAQAQGAAEVASSSLATIALELSRKADLFMGKVPYDQLPEFPVGRKVNVANKAARLALVNYTDLTIAYESDTGEAWGLDANADASVEANWSRLGNAQAIGVSSFNGRTGNVAPQAGDYDAGKISETLERRYVTTEQITAWNAKPGPQDIADAINQALSGGELPFETKQHATDTYLTKGARGAVSGVAPLDVDGRVPDANLPDKLFKARQWRDVKASRGYDTWATNSTGAELDLFIRTNAISDSGKYIIIKMRPTPTGTIMNFQGDAVSVTGSRYLEFQVKVPIGWQYAVYLSGGTATLDISAIGVWRELS